MFFLWFFFFKQKTAYEMRISDWSSDVCSSDLAIQACPPRMIRAQRRSSGDGVVLYDGNLVRGRPAFDGIALQPVNPLIKLSSPGGNVAQIGRASCRERVCQYV